MSARVVLVLAGLAALVLPLPGVTVPGVALAVVGLLALGLSPARPGSAAPTVLIAAAALSWLSSPDDRLPHLRLIALALALALVHSSAAIAAVLPVRAHVPARLLLRWGAWTAAATAVGAGAVTGVEALRIAVAPIWVSVAAVLAIGACATLLLAGSRGATE